MVLEKTLESLSRRSNQSILREINHEYSLEELIDAEAEASILWHSAFSIVQLLYLYMTAGKTIALTIWTFVSKVMSLLFNTWSKCVSLRTC